MLFSNAVVEGKVMSMKINKPCHENIQIDKHQGKNLTGVMPVKGHFARQKHTPNKNARQVTYQVYIFPFHVKGP